MFYVQYLKFFYCLQTVFLMDTAAFLTLTIDIIYKIMHFRLCFHVQNHLNTYHIILLHICSSYNQLPLFHSQWCRGKDVQVEKILTPHRKRKVQEL